MTRPSGKIYTLSLFPAIDTTLYLEGMETGAGTARSAGAQ